MKRLGRDDVEGRGAKEGEEGLAERSDLRKWGAAGERQEKRDGRLLWELRSGRRETREAGGGHGRGRSRGGPVARGRATGPLGREEDWICALWRREGRPRGRPAERKRRGWRRSYVRQRGRTGRRRGGRNAGEREECGASGADLRKRRRLGQRRRKKEWCRLENVGQICGVLAGSSEKRVAALRRSGGRGQKRAAGKEGSRSGRGLAMGLMFAKD